MEIKISDKDKQIVKQSLMILAGILLICIWAVGNLYAVVLSIILSADVWVLTRMKVI
jgi:hypothetical protein